MFTVNEYSVPGTETIDLDLMTPLLYRVTDKFFENKSLATLTLEPVSDSISPISPGQFNMLYVFGKGEIPISVSSIIHNHPALTHTIQDVGMVSKGVCALNIGDTLGIRGPFGRPFPVEEAKFKDIVIMAGGVGLAPLRPVIEYIAANRDDYGEVNFLYGTRDPDSIIYHRDIISLQSDPSINFQVTVDHSFTSWRGNVGVVTNLIEKAEFDPTDTYAFVVGPEVMMRYAVYSLIDAFIPEEQIFISMERNMKCAVGHCGHCQLGPLFVCKDGPVFSYPEIKPYLNVREL